MTRNPALALALGLPLLLTACGSDAPEAGVELDPIALSEAPVLEATPVALAVQPARAVDPGAPVATAVEATAPAPPVLAGLPSTEITLRHGESLVLLADWTGVTSEELAELNGIDVTAFLVAGQPLRVPLHAVTVDQLEEARSGALDRRLDRYMRGRGGLAGVDTHRVRTGETAWSIARDRHGLPTWVLAAFNPDVDLDRLRIGDGLQVPVLADTVADLGAEPAEEAVIEPATESLGSE